MRHIGQRQAKPSQNSGFDDDLAWFWPNFYNWIATALQPSGCNGKCAVCGAKQSKTGTTLRDTNPVILMSA